MYPTSLSQKFPRMVHCACVAFLFSVLVTRSIAVELTLVSSNVTMPSGQTFQMPLSGSDPQDSPLTFSVVSITSSNLTGVIAPVSNRSLLLNVSGVDATNGPFTGDLVLQLYEDLVPLTTARIIELAESGFYDGLTFHRVIQNFMCQGGDPLGTGSGGTGVKFDDEFVASLTFNGFGQFAMANSGDDSNDSQFFITDADLSYGGGAQSPHHLNFNHTIFGQVTSGFDVLTKIIETPVSGDTPVTPVLINSATVFTNTAAAVLRLSATAGFTGSTDVTVSVVNTNNQTDTQMIQVTVVSDTVNDAAFLGPVPSSLITTQNTAVAFILTATDIDNDSLNLALADAATGEFPLNLQASFNPNTSLLTLVPNATTGVVNLIIGVKDASHPFDTQHFSLTVNPCSYSISSTSNTISGSGGSGSVMVTAAGGCTWTTTNTNSWITVTHGSSSAGNDTVQYNVAANNNVNARSGTLTIAGHLYTIHQNGVACSYTLNSSSTNHTASAAAGSFGITSPGGCAWSAGTTDTWIHTTSSGSGSGTVNYTVDANSEITSRSGALTVEDKTFSVTQAGIGCSYLIAPTNVNAGAAGSNGTVNVTAANGCDWTTSNTNDWIMITGGTGSGMGTVNYSVAVNSNMSARVGTLTIAGQTFTVNQAEAPPPLDLAVISIKAPKKITLSDATPSQTGFVKVSLQNQSPQSVVIPDADTFDELVQLTVQSLGGCSNPSATILSPTIFPIDWASKAKLTVVFEVTFDCVNDPLITSKTEDHSDYGYVATVDVSALDDMIDADPIDDVCPHSVTPPYRLDPYPDGKIKDKGCGNKKLDKTLGADVLTDVIEK